MKHLRREIFDMKRQTRRSTNKISFRNKGKNAIRNNSAHFIIYTDTPLWLSTHKRRL